MITEPNNDPSQQTPDSQAQTTAAPVAKPAAKRETPISDEDAAALAKDLLDIEPYSRELAAKPNKKKAEPAKPPEKTQRPAKTRPAAERPPSESIDYERLAEATGRGVAAAMADTRAKAEPEKKTEIDLSFLTSAEKRKLPVLREMEALDDAYKGIADRYVKSLKETADYQAQWETDHPGQEFNPEDAEHNDFFAKHTVDWEDSDFLIATGNLSTGKAAQEIKGKTDVELEKLRFNEQVRDTAPVLYAEQKRVGRNTFAQFGEEWKDVVGENGAVDQAKINQLWDEHPLEAPFILEAATRAESFTVENLRMHQGMRAAPDGKSVLPLPFKADGSLAVDKLTLLQRDIFEFATESQAEILALPKSDQRDEQGRQFLPNAQYAASQDPAKARKFWTLDAALLNKMKAVELVNSARERIQAETAKHEKWAAKRQGGDAQPAARPNGQPAYRPQTQRPEESYKPRSPSSSGGVRPSVERAGSGIAARKDGRLLVTDIL